MVPPVLTVAAAPGVMTRRSVVSVPDAATPIAVSVPTVEIAETVAVSAPVVVSTVPRVVVDTVAAGRTPAMPPMSITTSTVPTAKSAPSVPAVGFAGTSIPSTARTDTGDYRSLSPSEG